MRCWRILPHEHGEPGALVERSARLLDGLADDPAPTLRWYRATKPAVVLGRGQHELAELAGELPVVARHSGGGAVLLDDAVLSLDVLLPSGHPLLAGDLGDVFGHLGRAWSAALEELGVTALAVHDGPSPARRRGTKREQLLAAVCYATVGRGEVTAGGRKLVGLAQRRRRAGALVQCGLLLRWEPARLLRRLGADPADPTIAGAAVGLETLLDPTPRSAEITRAVESHLEAAAARAYTLAAQRRGEERT